MDEYTYICLCINLSSNGRMYISEFCVQWSVRGVICVTIYPTRCNNIQFTYIYKLLYMFRVVSPPIIRSSYHYIYSIWHY